IQFWRMSGSSKVRKDWGMNGSTPPLLVAKPTATTVPSRRAVTPLNTSISAITFALETMLQLVPFQCSLSARSSPELASLNVPTAKMSCAEMAAMPTRPNDPGNLRPASGLGLTMMAQLLPSKCSTSAVVGKGYVFDVAVPTAQTSVGEIAVTAWNEE